MAYRCKIFGAVNFRLHGISILIDAHLCPISKQIGINKEKEMCLPSKKSIMVINMKEQIWLTNVKCL